MSTFVLNHPPPKRSLGGYTTVNVKYRQVRGREIFDSTTCSSRFLMYLTRTQNA